MAPVVASVKTSLTKFPLPLTMVRTGGVVGVMVVGLRNRCCEQSRHGGGDAVDRFVDASRRCGGPICPAGIVDKRFVGNKIVAIRVLQRAR